MRTLRLSLVGTVILVLLGGLDGVVMARDEPADPAAPVAVTGSVGFGHDIDPGTQSYGDEVARTEGAQGVLLYEASDPRLSGEVTFTGNMYNWMSDEIYVGTGTRVLVNDDGRWVGTDTGLGLPDGMADMEFMIMRGEGAYEGLTALVVEDWAIEPPTFVGAIVPDAPPFPELPAEVTMAVEPLIPTMDVVVATQRIEQGASLQPEMLTQRSVPLDATNEMALTDPVLAHGKQAAIDILPNQVITPNMLVGD